MFWNIRRKSEWFSNMFALQMSIERKKRKKNEVRALLTGLREPAPSHAAAEGRRGARSAAPIARPPDFTPWWPRHHHSFRGSFSAGSKPIFASKAAFFSIFQNLQENHHLASKFWKFLPKNWKNLQTFWHFLANFAKFCKNFRNPQKFSKILQNFCRILQKCVDFEKCWKMLYWMQKFMEILLKFDKILTKFWQNSINAQAENVRRV